MALEFRQHSTLGEGTYTVVLKNGRRLGGIYHPPDGVYRFHLGDSEKLGGPDLSDPDLEDLKRKILSKHGP
jgi:hypothetical protein